MPCNPLRMAGLGLFLVLAVLSVPAQAQEDQAPDCDNQVTQADMNSCAYLEFEAADTELNAVYRKALKSQQDMDREVAVISKDYVGAVKSLKKAQRAWIDYRDGHCDGVGYEAIGGSMQPMLINGCMAAMTKARTKELRELMEGIGN